jgi:hypothetical protein
MKNETKIFGLKPKKVALLLTLGSSTTNADDIKRSENQKAELLKYRLSKVILPGHEKIEEVSEVTEEIFDILGSLVGDQVGELLFIRSVSVEMLRKIQKYGKHLVRMAKSDMDREVGYAIYYAAISNALVYRHKKITKLTYEELYDAYNSLRKKTWIGEEMQDIFKTACSYCRQHRK